MSDPGTSYRNRDEIQEYRKKRDPILLLKKIGLQFNLATEEEFQVTSTKFRKLTRRPTNTSRRR